MEPQQNIGQQEKNGIMGKAKRLFKIVAETFMANKEALANNETLIVGILILMSILILIIGSVITFAPHRSSFSASTIASTVNGKLASISTISNSSYQNSFYDYYIKTAYNCCSAGSYKDDYISQMALINVLKQGVRGLDFEIYSINNEPVVATSTSDDNYHVKETYNYVKFADVMNIISSNAFNQATAPNYNDPIVFHIRFMSANMEMYKALASLFKEYDRLFMGSNYSYEYYGKNYGKVPIQNLCGKISVIVDKSNSFFMDCSEFYEYVNMTSNSIFMRALRYYNVQNTPDLVELQNYNKQNMTISLPDITATTNSSAIVSREAGCQMIAMCYQFNDVYLQENNSYFDNRGSAFVLKPDNLRYIPQTIPDPVPQNPALSYAPQTVVSDYYAFNI
jgi:hypothetical protein